MTGSTSDGFLRFGVERQWSSSDGAKGRPRDWDRWFHRDHLDPQRPQLSVQLGLVLLVVCNSVIAKIRVVTESAGRHQRAILVRAWHRPSRRGRSLRSTAAMYIGAQFDGGRSVSDA